MSAERRKKRLNHEYKDVDLFKINDLIIQRQGGWLGVGYVYGIREEQFWVSWQLPGAKQPTMLPYSIEDVKINIGTKKWMKIEKNEEND